MTTDKYVSLTIFLHIIQFIPYCILLLNRVLRNIQTGKSSLFTKETTISVGLDLDI